MGLFDVFFGNKNDKIKDYKSRDAIILDVRSEKEYSQGAIKGAKNVPLQNLVNEIESLKKLNKPVITCCASGVRSAKAAKVLKVYDIEAINGGGWKSLERKL